MAVRQKSKAEQTYRVIKKSLLSGVFKPGARLSEGQIAKKMGFGRMPVREAMFKLQAEGLLKKNGAYGRMYVEYIEDQKVEDVVHRYEFREVIESQACRLAAKNMNGWQIDGLRNLLRILSESYQNDNREKRYEASLQFHAYILKNCGNPHMFQVWEEYRLMPFSPRSETVEARIQSHLADMDRHHGKLRTIVEAIASHNPDLAERTMREFIQEITEAIRVAFQESLETPLIQ
jgi:DNA-binding GntR family transcriptional regulator